MNANANANTSQSISLANNHNSFDDHSDDDRYRYSIARELFMRSMALIYFVAFLSWFIQFDTLYSSDGGLLPIKKHLMLSASKFEGHSADRWWFDVVQFPSLVWLSNNVFSSEPDALLKVLLFVGIVVSALLVAGAPHRPLGFAFCWLCYLSLVNVGSTFAMFQWDILLLESGFLTIWYALTSSSARASAPLFNWMVRWLLFRLMFSSGIVKLLSNSSVWWDFTALAYHFGKEYSERHLSFVLLFFFYLSFFLSFILLHVLLLLQKLNAFPMRWLGICINFIQFGSNY
jgi:hypothetical protein